MPNTWASLPRLSDDHLIDARLQAHWAAQVITSVGYTFVKPDPDWSHVSLSFSDGRLRSRPATGLGFSASIDTARMVLTLHDGDQTEIDSLSLEGRTLNDSYTWLASAISRLHSDLDVRLVRPDHELPHHPVGTGGSFETKRASDFAAVSDWFHNADLAIEHATESEPGASPVRCWPHHFDIASLITIDSDPDPEEARSIGVGMSPGDGNYDQPYYYVTPWPYPAADQLPDLGDLGFWHTEGWIGAILTAETITSGDSSSNQEPDVSSFLRNAVGACRIVLDARSF